MSDAKTYKGSCHCGKVQYEVETALEQVIDCNCSMCSRSGSLLTFVGEDRFKLLSGEEALKDYRFNTKAIAHLFCTECGIRSFGRGTGPNGPMYAVNVRCLEGVDPASLKVVHVDGRSR